MQAVIKNKPNAVVYVSLQSYHADNMSFNIALLRLCV